MTVTAKYLNQLAPQLNDRDLAIITDIGRFKLMTGGQIERLYFADSSDKSRARNRQAVLKRLKDHEVIAHVGKRRVGGSMRGSALQLWSLDIAGQHLAQTGQRPRRPYSWYEPTIAHFLAVADVYVELVEADRSGLLKLLKFDAEPYSWRDFGSRTLKPDAFAQIGIVHRDGRRRKSSFFIEVDRANQYGTKIDTKLPQYLAYYRHDRMTQPDRAFPRVVFLAPDDKRVAYLGRLITEYPEPPGLFSVGFLEDPVTALLSR
jgi:hypothetical protein